MPEPRTYHLPNITVLLCIGVDCLGLEALQRHDDHIVVSNMTELRGWR